MGLDISAYRGLVPAPEANSMSEEDCYSADIRTFYKGSWSRADDIDDRVPYRCAGSFGFRAGSYGGYSQWRDQLAEMVGLPEVMLESYGLSRPSHAAAIWGERYTPGPFAELINFSDCEGVIGTAVSAKLAADFAEWQAKADAHDDDWFREKYADWRKAFEMAADGGCVEFH